MEKKSEISWSGLDYLNRWIPFGSYYFLAGFLVFAVGIGIFSAIVKTAITVDAQGKLNSEQKPVPIKSPVAFTVDQIFIKENELIKKGTKILSSKDSITPEQMALVERYRNLLLSVVKDFKGNPKCSECLYKLQQTTLIYGNFTQQQDIIEIIGSVQTTSLDLKRQIEESQSIGLQTADVRHNIAINEGKIAKIKQQRAERILAREYEQLTQELVALKTRIRTKEQENLLNLRRSAGQLEAQLSDFQSKLDKKTKTYVIEAPFDGVTSSVKIKGKGEILSPGEVILELIPAGSKLVSELTITAKDIPLIKAGMDTTLYFDAFPEAEYGTIKGTVVSIDRFEVPAANGQTDVSFRAQVSMESQGFTKNGKSYPFLVGMTTRGKILVGYQTLLQTAINQLFHIGNEF